MALFDFVTQGFKKAKDDLVKSRFNLVDQTRSAIALARPVVQQGIRNIQASKPSDYFYPTSKSFLDTPIAPKIAGGSGNKTTLTLRNQVVQPIQRAKTNIKSNAFQAFMDYSNATPPGVDDVISRGIALAPIAFTGLKNVSKLRVSPKVINVSKLISHEGAPDKARVDFYKDLINKGGRVDPLKVIKEGSKFGVEDGKHRLQALLDLGIKKAPVEDITKQVNRLPVKSVAQPPLGDVLPVKKTEPQVKALEVKSPILKATGTPRTLETNPSRLLAAKPPKGQGNVSSPNIIQPRSTRGGITPPKVDFTKWKDGETLSLTRETLERNIEGVAKGDSGIVKQFIVDPVRNNETKRIQFLTQTKQEVKDTVKRLGISAGSKEDALIQRFGEGNMTAEELRAATPKWQQVMEGAQYFRSKYDDLLNQVNAQRQQFGYNPIPKRQDYFRHFQEINDAIGQFGLLLREQDIPTEISGLTSIFKPGKPFSTAELQRKGVKTTESAIKGMDNYLDSISKQMFHIDSVQRARSLETYIRDAAKEGQANLPNFVANLREYGNLVSGKKGTVDRAFEGIIGRKVFGLSRFLTQRTSANLVGGNISSALTNFIPFTQSIATTSKPAALHGILDAMTSPFTKNIAKIGDVESKFLIRRFGDRGPISKSILQKGGEAANYVFKTVDQFVSKSVVSGKYYQAISEGKTPQEAIKIADEYAGRIITDRSLGNLPNLFGQKTLGPFTQFQAEVNNMYSFIKKDIPNISDGNALKIASALGQFAVLSYVYNSAFEKIAGRRPTLDPIQAGLTAAGLTDDSEGQDLGSNLISAGGDIAENLPFSGILSGGGRIPIGAGIPDIPGLIKGETSLGKEALKPITTLLPPFGGGQAKKTFEGLKSFQEGVSTTPTGRIRFNVEQTPTNLLKNAVFGQYSTEAGQKYIQNLGKSKSEILANDFKKLKTPEEKKALWNQYVKEGKITKENVSDIKKQFEDQKLKVKGNEKTIRGLPVQDGSRTRSILKEFNRLDTPEEKKALWDRYVKLGIITKDVAKQLKKELSK